MKARIPAFLPLTALVGLIFSAALMPDLSAQVTAVEFGGNYNGSNTNADKTGYTLENGDFDGEADSDDRRGFISFGTLFININDANGVGNNTTIYHGTQHTHLDATAADPAIGIFRFEDNAVDDRLQCGHGGTTAITQQTFAPHVVKSDFLNGADTSGSTLAFEDAAGSVTVSLAGKVGKVTVNRALVKSGDSWYVSSTTSSSETALSINGYTEMWIPYDPDANIYLSATTLAGTAVAGSTLNDIQAFGAVIQQDDIASGQGNNDDRFSVDGFSARMVATPLPLAVSFGGDYATGNSTSGAIPSQTLENGDFDGEADADDRRAFTPFGTNYPGRPDNLGPDDGTADNTSFKHGYQLTYFDFTGADPTRGIYRYFGNNNAQDSLQTGNGPVDASNPLTYTFAPYVEKSDFLNGIDAVPLLTFADRAGSIAMDAIKQAGTNFTYHAIVQDGGNWYISGSSSTAGTPLTLNGATETWYPYDPGTNLLIPPTTTGGVLGSTLNDIRAVGMVCENIIPAGSGNNANIFRPQGMTALLEASPVLVPAVRFGGDYTTSTTTSGSIPDLSFENGDFDGEADGEDRCGFVAMGTNFPGRPGNDGPDDGTVDNTSFKHGFQLTYFDFTGADPSTGVYRYFGNGQDSLQMGAGPVDASNPLTYTFAPYVEKADFLFGFDAVPELTFVDAAGSITMDVVRQSGPSVPFRAIVQNGTNWYVSGTSTTAQFSPLTINGATETWYPYDPDTNLLIPQTTTGGVLGSTLTDIQAVGSVCENILPAGSSNNAHVYRVQGMTALLEQKPVITNTFVDWIAGFPGVGTEDGFDQDPDGDGIDNGVENFFGTAPDVFSQGIVVGTVDTGANTFTFTHPQSADPASDLTATYRWSTDLATWYDGDNVDGPGGGLTVGIVADPVGPPTTTGTATASQALPSLFLRVEVTQD